MVGFALHFTPLEKVDVKNTYFELGKVSFFTMTLFFRFGNQFMGYYCKTSFLFFFFRTQKGDHLIQIQATQEMQFFMIETK